MYVRMYVQYMYVCMYVYMCIRMCVRFAYACRASMYRSSSAWEDSQMEAGYPTSFWRRYV